MPPLRIVQANAVYDSAAKTPDALLDVYHTLTEWSVAMAGAGAAVSVVQRFKSQARVERDGVVYELTADKLPPWLATRATPLEFIDAIARQSPDVVHVNGLIFPTLVAGIRAAIGPRPVIVAQHHGGEFPIRGEGFMGFFHRRRWLNGLAAADAVSFTAAAQAEPWRAAGVLADQRVLEIVEASTTLRTVTRERARAAIGAGNERLILWVGRLTTNKDPLTVLDGLEQALPNLGDARMVMVFGDDTLIGAVDQRVRASAPLAERVTLAGRVSRDELPNYYGAADLFVSGSRFEGSGYALIEAMAAGLVPVVTDIPSFRTIAGDCGARWPPGEAAAFAAALLQMRDRDVAAERARVIAHFEAVLSWPAIAARTLSEYQSLANSKQRIPP